MIQVVPLGTLAANINVDLVSGHLWVAGNPDGKSLLKHAEPPHTAITPSQVQWTRRSIISTGNFII